MPVVKLNSNRKHQKYVYFFFIFSEKIKFAISYELSPKAWHIMWIVWKKNNNNKTINGIYCNSSVSILLWKFQQHAFDSFRVMHNKTCFILIVSTLGTWNP